jgi:hypothetical protein
MVRSPLSQDALRVMNIPDSIHDLTFMLGLQLQMPHLSWASSGYPTVVHHTVFANGVMRKIRSPGCTAGTRRFVCLLTELRDSGTHPTNPLEVKLRGARGWRESIKATTQVAQRISGNAAWKTKQLHEYH